MTRLALATLAAALAAAPALGQEQKILECPIAVAHGCTAEKCQNVGQMPTFRIDLAGKRVCYGTGGSPCTNWEEAEIFQGVGGSTTIGVGRQRLIMWVDDRLKLKGARLSGLGVAAFFADCKPG